MEDFVCYDLRNHQQYLRLLGLLNSGTQYIDLVPLCPQEDVVVPWALKHLELVEEADTTRWNGSISSETYHRYCFRWSQDAFEYFMSLHNFFIYYIDPDGERSDMIFETEFGWTDIAFLDAAKAPLFFTVTHEGLAFLHRSLICSV